MSSDPIITSNMSKPRKPRLRYFYRGICAVALTAVALIMFLIIWFTYVSNNNHTGLLLGWGNLSLVAILYALLFSIIGKFLKAFKIGVERKSKQVASIILTACVTDFIEILVSCK